MMERRRTPRFRTLKAARIIFDRQLSPMLCAMRDVSQDGACLFLGLPARVPEEFDLSVPSENFIYHCRVAWRTRDRIGVAFAPRQN